MMDIISHLHLCFEDIGDMFLSDHSIKGFWAVFICEAHLRLYYIRSKILILV